MFDHPSVCNFKGRIQANVTDALESVKNLLFLLVVSLRYINHSCSYRSHTKPSPLNNRLCGQRHRWPFEQLLVDSFCISQKFLDPPLISI